MADPIMVHKVTLPGGRVVILKDIEIRDEENAAKLAAKKAGESALGMSYLLNIELLKILILEIDGVKLTAIDREQIDKKLKYQEIVSLRKVVQSLAGESQAEPTVEFIASGGQ